MKPAFGPSPLTLYPIQNNKRTIFIKNLIKDDRVIIGDYTYYDDPESPEDFTNNILYHFPFIKDKLIIGKFTIIAAKAKFMMNGANHRVDWLTTYNFSIFENEWDPSTVDYKNWPSKGDTVIGNDVWIGYDALIMPGVKVGDGAVVGANSVVTKDVPPYTIVGGNPAKELRKRFNSEQIITLMDLEWWNWDIDKITRNINLLCSNNLEALKNAD